MSNSGSSTWPRPSTVILVERLREVDPDDLTPRQALELVYELREQAGAPG